MDLVTCVTQFKSNLENAIVTGQFGGKTYSSGHQAKEALIRSQQLINLLHEVVKSGFSTRDISPAKIFPPIGLSKPEMKIAGFLKQKDQDICVVPSNIPHAARKIDWGPMANENIIDAHGFDLSSQTLVVNVRSQMSSLAKNSDTLFERTFAEALNLHVVYPSLVLGEVYMIPVYEYDDIAMVSNTVAFKKRQTNIQKYISFFSALNNRINEHDESYKYEACSLIIVDFSRATPKIYSDTASLKADKLVADDFALELSDLSFDSCLDKLISAYSTRFEIKNLL